MKTRSGEILAVTEHRHNVERTWPRRRQCAHLSSVIQGGARRLHRQSLLWATSGEPRWGVKRLYHRPFVNATALGCDVMTLDQSLKSNV